jgi:chromosome segregation ATPase
MVKALTAAEAAARAEVVAAKPRHTVKGAETNVARKRTHAEAAQKAVEELRAKLDKATAALADANEALGKAQGELDRAIAREANPEHRATNIVKAVETALRKATKFATEVAPQPAVGAGGAADAHAAVQKAQEFGIRSLVDLIKAKVDTIMDELEKEKSKHVCKKGPQQQPQLWQVRRKGPSSKRHSTTCWTTQTPICPPSSSRASSIGGWRPNARN